MLHPHRLFPADPSARAIAGRLYDGVKDLPLLCPHGHTEARWFAENEPFPDPATLLIQPDHYIFRMLYSQGIELERLGIGEHPIADPQRRMAVVCQTLLSVPRNTYPALAGLRI